MNSGNPTKCLKISRKALKIRQVFDIIGYRDDEKRDIKWREKSIVAQSDLEK